VVIVEEAENDVVPDGANQMEFDAVADETTVTDDPPTFVMDGVKTVSWFVGAVLSTVNVAPDVGAEVTTFPATSVPIDNATVAVPSPEPTVWMYV
jgi:hypothetical protein